MTPPESAQKKTRSPRGTEEGDASRGEVAIYAVGNIEGAIADNFPNVLQNILVVAAHVNPLLLGLIMGIKTLWDAVTDPIMAHITDNTRSPFGRRRPYILAGGVSRVIFLTLFVAFLPSGGHLTRNHVMEAQKTVNDAVSTATAAHRTAVAAYTKLQTAKDDAERGRILNQVEGRIEAGFLSRLIGMVIPPKETAIIPLAERSLRQLEHGLPVLEEDLAERRRAVQIRREALAAAEEALAKAGADGRDGAANSRQRKALAEQVTIARAVLETAESKEATVKGLIDKGLRARGSAVAAAAVARHLLASSGRQPDETHLSKEGAERQAAARMAALGLGPAPVFEAEPEPLPKPRPPSSPFSAITDGLQAFFDPHNHEQRGLIIYVLIGVLIFTTLTTVNSVPYYALGIELSPSYNGRTQVVVYRAVTGQIMGLIAPWVPVFCFSLHFSNAFQGLFWVALTACFIGIPSTLLMFFKTRERTRATIKKAGERPNLIQAMFQIAKAPDFLRILFLYVFIGLVNGLFTQIGFYLNVYWVAGSALSGAMLGAQVAMVAWVLGLVSLPVINWACRRFQKHRVLQFAVVWMAIGTALKWWAMNPDHPEYQFILPFFFSVGISSVYTVLPTMMADVTDLDELKYGFRREGMFGAVMAFLMKGISTVVPVAAGAVLLLSGFDPSLEYRQDPGTILNMRILYSFVPAVMLLGALVVLVRYPLTRERVQQIKQALKARHAGEESGGQAL